MQINLDLGLPLPAEAYDFGVRSSGDTHGVVLTKRHVVELILDLAGYSPARDLTQLRLLEPACGHGAFLLPAVERLLASAAQFKRGPESLLDSVVAYDIDSAHVGLSKAALTETLRTHGVDAWEARTLVDSWVRQGDFLLSPDNYVYDVVVGNPPYIRIEQLAGALQQEYRQRFASLFDRADLYVAFIEKGLNLLGPSGVLSFVCADRWTLNRYGAPLRQLVSDRFHVRTYIDLHHASPFESEVVAYPAIFSIGRAATERVTVAKLATASAEECQGLSAALLGAEDPPAGVVVSEYQSWFSGTEPWVLSSPEQLALLRQLESRLAPLESGDTKVGIGVATGNDKIYIVGRDADIEADRLVPLVMREDIVDGRIKPTDRCVINTFREGGGTVDLLQYPRLAKYLAQHAAPIRERHVARGNPNAWFRTIDRVYPSLVKVPKLLLPDIAGSNEVALDEGHYHPHHNLYFVTSGSWDMRVLGALLSSKVALFFVWSYAVKMRGGYLRFQAQYIRRIRLPAPSDIKPRQAKALASAFEGRDFLAIDRLALAVYGLESLPDFGFVDTRR